MSESVCPHCGGSGWKIVEHDGASGAERCNCRESERAGALEERAGIPPLYRNASLDNFKLPADNPTANRGLASVLLTVKSFTREFPSEKKSGLLLIGEPGTGKTHLAVAALRVLISRAALDAEILLLDDLGTHRVTEWVEDTVTAIITDRCNNRKPLIATTNLPDPEVGDVMIERDSGLPEKAYAKVSLAQRLGERARSRLFEMCRVVRMPSVEDYRLRKIGRAY